MTTLTYVHRLDYKLGKYTSLKISYQSQAPIHIFMFLVSILISIRSKDPQINTSRIIKGHPIRHSLFCSYPQRLYPNIFLPISVEFYDLKALSLSPNPSSSTSVGFDLTGVAASGLFISWFNSIPASSATWFINLSTSS